MPCNALRQSRAVPAARTIVVASTASTAHARKTEINNGQKFTREFNRTYTYAVRAIYFEELNGPLTIQDLPIPTPNPDSVVIKVEATGLCRSDWHGYVGHDTDIKLPHVPGHEFAGTIYALGENVKNFELGTRVTVPFVNGCGTRTYCKSGNAQVCPTQTEPASLNLVHLQHVTEQLSLQFRQALLQQLLRGDVGRPSSSIFSFLGMYPRFVKDQSHLAPAITPTQLRSTDKVKNPSVTN
jgi:hypothetical protein